MRRWLLRIGRIVIFVVIFAVTAWATGLPLPARVERVIFGAKPPIVVGLIHSESGPMAIGDRSLQDAEVLALEEINALGGIKGRRVTWQARDPRSDPATAAVQARELIEQDGAVALFGCWTSEARKAVQAVVEDRRSLLVFAANYEGMERSRRTIYAGGSANQSIVPAVRWCSDALKARRFFVVGTEETWSRTVAEIGKDAAKAAGGEVVGEAYLPLGGGGEDAAAGAVKASRPDVVLNMIVGAPNTTFLAAMSRAGLAPDRMPSICFGFAEDELRRFPPADMAGLYSGMAYYQSLPRPEGREFVRKFKARFGQDRAVSDSIVAAYNGVLIWSQAVQEAGSPAADAVLAHVDRQSLDAPEGVVTIDPATRVAWRPFHVGRARADGQFEVVFSIRKPIRPLSYVATRSIGQWRAFLDRLRAGWGGRWSAPTRQQAPAPAPARRGPDAGPSPTP